MKKRFPIILLIAFLAVSALLLSGCGTHKAIYNGNGNTGGTVPVDTTEYRTGQSITVLYNEGELVRKGYCFAGWSTSPDGSGTIYNAGDTLKMRSSDITLYAVWAYHVAYIYKPGVSSEVTAVGSFKGLLGPVYPTDAIAISAIETTDFSDYTAVIISREATPLTVDQANVIKNTNLPVVGINKGGTDYFAQIGLNMTYGNTATFTIAGCAVVNSALTIWNKPNALGVSNGNIVAVFASGSSANPLYAPNMPAGVLHVATKEDNSNYDAIAIQGRNLYWSYYDDASCFTEAGKKLFINAIHHMVCD